MPTVRYEQQVNSELVKNHTREVNFFKHKNLVHRVLQAVPYLLFCSSHAAQIIRQRRDLKSHKKAFWVNLTARIIWFKKFYQKILSKFKHLKMVRFKF